MMTPTSHEAYQLFHKGTLAFSRAEHHGIRIDIDYCKHTLRKLDKKQQNLEDDFKHTSFFKNWNHVYHGKANIYSHFQLSHMLYDVRKLKPIKETDTGKGATDAEALKQLRIKDLQPLMKLSKIKIQQDNLQRFLRETVDGYMHPTFNLNLAKTYRSSCNDPNFQAIPTRDLESKNIVRGAVSTIPPHTSPLILQSLFMDGSTIHIA